MSYDDERDFARVALVMLVSGLLASLYCGPVALVAMIVAVIYVRWFMGQLL